MAFSLNPQSQSEYQRLFDTCVIKTDKLPEVNAIIDKIITGKARYEGVGGQLNIPWYFIGIIHCMEGGLSFNKHLHNGDPLGARTVQVPKGRPKPGNPPFTWEQSALDSLTFEKIDQWLNWSVPGMLYKLEAYNGFGYRNLQTPINSPYLWSYSNQYTKGKFASDGKFDPKLVSKQAGAAVLLRRMAEKQILSLGISDRLSLIKQLGDIVNYAPNRVVEKARELQQQLNLAGAHLTADGKAGKMTSDAYSNLTGKFLTGDPRNPA